MFGKKRWRLVSKKGNFIGAAVFTVLFSLMLVSSAFAGDGGPPDNPGCGDEQDLFKAQTVLWLLPYGFDLYIEDEAGDIFLDWQYNSWVPT